MEQKLDLIMEMLTTMKQDIDDLKQIRPMVEFTRNHVAKMSEDITSMKETLDRTERHLVRVDERLTTTQNIKKLYSDEALKSVEAV